MSDKLSAFSYQPVRGGRAAARPPHGTRLTVASGTSAPQAANSIGESAPNTHQAEAGETRFAGGTSALQTADSIGDTASVTPPGRRRRNLLCGRDFRAADGRRHRGVNSQHFTRPKPATPLRGRAAVLQRACSIGEYTFGACAGPEPASATAWPRCRTTEGLQHRGSIRSSLRRAGAGETPLRGRAAVPQRTCSIGGVYVRACAGPEPASATAWLRCRTTEDLQHRGVYVPSLRRAGAGERHCVAGTSWALVLKTCAGNGLSVRPPQRACEMTGRIAPGECRERDDGRGYGGMRPDMLFHPGHIVPPPELIPALMEFPTMV